MLGHAISHGSTRLEYWHWVNKLRMINNQLYLLYHVLFFVVYLMIIKSGFDFNDWFHRRNVPIQCFIKPQQPEAGWMSFGPIAGVSTGTCPRLPCDGLVICTAYMSWFLKPIPTSISRKPRYVPLH